MPDPTFADPLERLGMHAVIDESRTRRLPPRVAVAMLLVACPNPASVARFLSTQRQNRQLTAWRRIIAANPHGCEILTRLLHEKAIEPQHKTLASVLDLFTRAAAIDPTAAMALHSLGDPAELQRGAHEVLRYLKSHRLLGKPRRLLDLGCGTGRMPNILAKHVAQADGVEPVPALARLARNHNRAHPNVTIHQTSGRDLSAFPDHSYDCILALDSFPYLTAARLESIHINECARVLAPGGDLVIVNWSYDHDAATDRAAVRHLAALHNFRVLRCGGRPFKTWDGELFHLRKRARFS